MPSRHRDSGTPRAIPPVLSFSDPEDSSRSWATLGPSEQLRVLGCPGEVSLSDPFSGCRWSEAEFLHRLGGGERRDGARLRGGPNSIHLLVEHCVPKNGESRFSALTEDREWTNSPAATETFRDSSPGYSWRPGRMVSSSWQEACTSWDRPKPSFPAGYRGRIWGWPGYAQPSPAQPRE